MLFFRSAFTVDIPRRKKKLTMGCCYGKRANQISAIKEEGTAKYQEFLKTYPNGCISRTEFSTLIRSTSPETVTEALEPYIFRMLDQNSDGVIGFTEFMNCLHIMTSGSHQENLKLIFRSFDINGNGTISWEEMKTITRDLFPYFSNEENLVPETNEIIVAIAFQEMDADQDSKITEEEFIKACFNQKPICKSLFLKIIDVFVPDGEQIPNNSKYQK